MTLLIGLRCSNGIIIGVDSMRSTGEHGAVFVNKTRVSRNTITATAGNSTIGDRFGDLIVSFLENNNSPDWADELTLRMQDDLQKIGKIRIPVGTGPICDFSALVAHKCNGSIELIKFGPDLINSKIEKDRFYQTIGSGAEQANPLLKYFINEYSPHNQPDIGQGFFITYLALKHSIAGSSAYIGYPIRIIVMEDEAKITEHVLDREYFSDLQNVDGQIIKCEEYIGELKRLRLGIVQNKYSETPDELPKAHG